LVFLSEKATDVELLDFAARSLASRDYPAITASFPHWVAAGESEEANAAK
jgi:hypothetical protein